jgi:hypothetical protein
MSDAALYHRLAEAQRAIACESSVGEDRPTLLKTALWFDKIAAVLEREEATPPARSRLGARFRGSLIVDLRNTRRRGA